MTEERKSLEDNVQKPNVSYNSSANLVHSRVAFVSLPVNSSQ